MEKKPNDAPQKPEPSPADEIAADAKQWPLSDDPFSEDNEVTVIQMTTKSSVTDLADDVTEVTAVDGVPIFSEDTTEPKLKNPFPSDDKEQEEKSASVSQSASKSFSNSKSEKFKFKIVFPKIPWHLSKRLVRERNIKILIGLVVIVSLMGLLNLGWRTWSRSWTAKTETKIKKQTAVSTLKLSPIAYTPSHPRPTPFEIKAGQSFEMRYSIDAWAKSKQDDLNFVGDLRIYSGDGKLIHYKPQYAQFLGRVDAKTEKIEIDNTIRLSPKTPPGQYRIMFDVMEKNTNQRASLQARIQVLPQE